MVILYWVWRPPKCVGPSRCWAPQGKSWVSSVWIHLQPRKCLAQCGFSVNAQAYFSAWIWSLTVNLQKILRQRGLSPKSLLCLPISSTAQVTLRGTPKVSHPKARHCLRDCGLALVPQPAWWLPQACLGKSHSCICTFNIPSSHGIHERTPAPGSHSPVLTAKIRSRYTLITRAIMRTCVLNSDPVGRKEDHRPRVTLCKSGIKSWYKDRINISRVRRRFWANVGVSKVAFSPLITKINQVTKGITNVRLLKNVLLKETSHSKFHPFPNAVITLLSWKNP